MGVKSLWSLLTPVGRPVMLETVEGKTMAIDSSIWLYQFQATMRDKEGRALVNAHLLGFLRRISKLLFYGIKPVFVFDGGAPALKRSTLNERKKKKSGAASSHVKLAEKLLAAQMRREALNHAQNTRYVQKGKGTNDQNSEVVLNEDTVYLEDLEGPTPRTPAKRKPPTPSSSSKKKNNPFRDHDPYNLPQVDLEEAVAKATKSAAPDPRLATEDELRAFIEEMRPEDFDINSPEFRELPTEVQYEIIGDLRLKSRQTSYARLRKMLKSAKTPLDFSKQQINNLRQRNALTQQLLMTTDSVGTANIVIPVRIASERNREYVLMKNEGVEGGWILGIKDIGTREKPIVLDHDDEPVHSDDDSDADMEEVEVPAAAPADPDLQEYQRDMALGAVARRGSHKGASVVHKPINRRSKSSALVDLYAGDDAVVADLSDIQDDDDLMAFALQESFDHSKSATNSHPPQSTILENPSSKPGEESPDDDMYEDYPAPDRLKTVISLANTTPVRKQTTSSTKKSSMFGEPSLLLSSAASLTADKDASEVADDAGSSSHVSLSEDIEMPPATTFLETSEGHPGPHSQGSTSDETSEHQVRPQLEDDNVPMFKLSGNLLSTPRNNATSTSTFAEINSVEKVSDKFEQQSSEPNATPPSFTLSNDDEEPLFAWSRTPSPMREFAAAPPSPAADEGWDAAEEMDVHAEEGEFARFMSQVKGRDVDDIRKEIDDEIKSLNQQKKNAMRDSEDITQQMISQVMTMLRLFGIPYITAPMEAEAQCAELVTLGLVDGVITDDSDVFLFGAQRVYKNMFNQSKTVECFLLTDLSRELGLDRDTLVRLAYLLGSDYTDGLPGVGPVVAMELLKEFPGQDGLHKFKDWWTKVQSGKDRPEDNQSKFRKQFKKKFKSLYLASDWPNSVVRDAYYHPTVDSSEEPFKWGMPDLDGLRLFLQQELGWKQAKVDELLLPIIQKMNKRNQAAALNRQGNLNDFLDISAGSGTYAPRQSRAYQSKRLQQVISDFRKQRRSSAGPSASSSRSGSKAPDDSNPGDNASTSGSDDDEEGPPTKRQRRKATTSSASGKESKGKGKAKSVGTSKPRQPRASTKGKGKAKAAPRRKSASTQAQSDEDDTTLPDSDADMDEFVLPPEEIDLHREVELNLRPRPKPKPKPKPKTISIESALEDQEVARRPATDGK
ncbi:PIN domain-like protein [Agrocybe pediades]|nr:PIN domain-like protein [Agrocybe pediades]